MILYPLKKNYLWVWGFLKKEIMEVLESEPDFGSSEA